MRWFRRRSSVELGTYVAPKPTDPPPVERIVDDGVLIAESLIVMTLRNHMIVDALRDKRDFDAEALAGLATRELDALADNEWETAERLMMQRENVVVDGAWLDDPDALSDNRRESRRREAVHRAMSAAFASRAVNRDILLGLVERARAEAWDEVAVVLLDRTIEDPVRDRDYDAQRNERLGAFLALDLSELAAERGVSLL
ncbi:hypothetical protein QMG83_09935 [Salinibacterium sp. G-O1]|uniref:hypothetical protein n=1 Tax=Salinibacterium sp. G-O1 TaxID=3046208 RepID=UPI0024BA57A3|nr:hypothetical protein [Salinibacterium sp. G-O1]MDJ0335541.1 hypothetical protein [Salinibacterium sp. G-O1]